jgi:DNA repair exonuclease SbcCD ATPase subunit
VNIHSFLQFWSGHNDTIIEVLVALVLLLIIYLAFRYYFHPESEEAAGAAGTVTAKIDTAEIEKTLQKILDNQSKIPEGMVAAPAAESLSPAAGLEGAPLTGAGASASSSDADLEALKNQLAEKERLLAQAREEASKALLLAQKAPPPTTDEDLKKLETKIKDLEARLAEYEIISEDIADLSFYKEENIRLQNELVNLKAGGGVAPTEASAPADPAPATPGEAAPASEDDIMKEFAKAVEEQKQAPPATPLAAAPSGTPAAEPKVEGENADLMNQFENFVKKE